MKYHFMAMAVWYYFIATSCSTEGKEQSIDSYPVFLPVVKDTSYYIEYVADIQALNNVELRSRVKGYVERIHVDEGQTVNEGQLLFTVNSLKYDKELQKAEAAYNSSLAQLRAAEVELANIQILQEKNIVSATELELQKSKVDALKAAVEEAKAHQELAALDIAYSQIRAPFKGVINRIPNKVGSLIEEGDMLTSISDNSYVFAYFNLSELEFLKYIDGENNTNRALLRMANNALYPYEGKIEIIESEFDQLTGNIAFRAKFPNPSGVLKHGANGKVMIAKDLSQVLMIPQKSTFEVQDKTYVYVVGKDSILEQRSIALKLRFPHIYVVESGLEPSELILFEGVQNVRSGTRISPKRVDARHALSLVSTSQQ
ncbi:MAG: efflux RND transporter periplasmic adaptor subunit [Cyclobacteriaceae bacterium]|jgi:membrane fusion protein (multidrug efflux system)|nr:efflux RND transporter periplasmic adaptor subunit [Cyclobacteriaceae bacterium]